jgi:HAD superfamily hydrolase (TIGR01549 family)
VTVIRAIFFDIGDTLLFDDPPLRDRVRQAIDLVELPYDKKGLPRAFRAAEDYALSRYLEGIPADDPDMQLRCAMIILRELGLADVGIDKLAALRHAFLSVSYQRGFHPDAITLVEELKSRGFKVGAISDWEETLPTLLAELELAKHLDSLAVSAIVGVTKPDPRLFREALRQADVPGAESIHVGDYYELDVAGAREAGMEPVLFDWKDRKPDADCVRVTTFKDLKTYLLSLPAP